MDVCCMRSRTAAVVPPAQASKALDTRGVSGALQHCCTATALHPGWTPPMCVWRARGASRDGMACSPLDLAPRRVDLQLAASGLGIHPVEHRPDLRLAFPGGPVPPVQLHEAYRLLDRLVPGLHFEDGEAADELLRLGERAVGDAQLSARETDAGAHRRGQEPSGLQEEACPGAFLAQPGDGFDELLGRRAVILGRLD